MIAENQPTENVQPSSNQENQYLNVPLVSPTVTRNKRRSSQSREQIISKKSKYVLESDVTSMNTILTKLNKVH